MLNRELIASRVPARRLMDTQGNSETGSLASGWAYRIHHPSSRQTLGYSQGLALLWVEDCPYATGDESPNDLIICGSEAQVPGSRVGAGERSLSNSS